PSSRAVRAEAPVPPRTATETLVAEVWREVLGSPAPLGVEDDFFDLGGHSLVATRVISRLEAALGLKIPLRTLFEAPRIGALAARIDVLREDGRPPADEPALVAVDRALEIPLSFAQERLWFLHQLAPETAAYGMTAGLRIVGPLDVGALRAALGDLVERHEALRTTFAPSSGRPHQVVQSASVPALPVERVDDLAAILDAESRRPFDLARGPLFRVRLLALAEGDHALVLSAHHAVLDGWSLGVLLRDLEAFYAARRAGVAASLPPLPVQYGDYAHWERQRLPALRADLDHWTARVRGVPALELPTDRPRPAIETHGGARRRVALPEALVTRLEEWARTDGATLFMVVAAGFEVLLGRMAEQERFCVGTSVAGRERPELEPLAGMFVNVLPLRAELSGDPSFRELVRRVREDALDAFAHGRAPFERIVEAAAPERDTSRSPIFQAMLVLQNTPPRRPVLEGLVVTELPGVVAAAKYELTLDLTRTAEGLEGEIEFRTDLFDTATVDAWSARLGSILGQAADAPDARIGDLDVVGPEERALLARWNATDVAPPRGTLHARFEAVAAADPDRPALVWGEASLSAGELDARADALAVRLRAIGFRPEDGAALCLTRSAEAIVGMLGTLKAGGVFVPLDPAHPRARLEELLAEARPRVLLTLASLASRLP
ncbi:MAG TPA: condensation domain-containing protein, partial [Vicinamibacteria bacterium]|nr:condensation domain-containing protein [Vicinamibacteria bacterium]